MLEQCRVLKSRSGNSLSLNRLYGYGHFQRVNARWFVRPGDGYSDGRAKFYNCARLRCGRQRHGSRRARARLRQRKRLLPRGVRSLDVEPQWRIGQLLDTHCIVGRRALLRHFRQHGILQQRHGPGHRRSRHAQFHRERCRCRKCLDACRECADRRLGIARRQRGGFPGIDLWHRGRQQRSCGGRARLRQRKRLLLRGVYSDYFQPEWRTAALHRAQRFPL